MSRWLVNLAAKALSLGVKFLNGRYTKSSLFFRIFPATPELMIGLHFYNIKIEYFKTAKVLIESGLPKNSSLMLAVCQKKV